MRLHMPSQPAYCQQALPYFTAFDSVAVRFCTSTPVCTVPSFMAPLARSGHSPCCIVFNTKAHDQLDGMQSLTLDVVKLRSVVRLADMMLCGQAVDMLVEGMTSLQACLHAQSPLLVQAACTHTSLAFQPSDQLMLKVCSSHQTMQGLYTSPIGNPRNRALWHAAFTHTSLAFQPNNQLMLKVLNITNITVLVSSYPGLAHVGLQGC